MCIIILMKNKPAKIFSISVFSIYGIMLLAFLLGQQDHMLDYDSASTPVLRSKNERGSTVFFYGSAVSCCFAVSWTVIACGIFAVW